MSDKRKKSGFDEEKSMRNIDRIRQMSLEELAPLLVYSTEEDIGDYDCEENLIPYYVTVWHSPSGVSFQDYGCNEYQDVVNDCIKWLDSEYEETNLSYETR